MTAIAKPSTSTTDATSSQIPDWAGDLGLQLKSQVSSLFPLPFTPLETFLLWDETPQNPMTSFIELHFETPLQLDALRAAIEVAMHRNPFLASRAVEVNGVFQWSYDKGAKPSIFKEEEYSPLHNGMPRPIYLREELGCRYWYRKYENGHSRLLIQLHHACCDGMGLRRVLIDVLAQYARRTGGDAVEMDTPNVATKSASQLDKLDLNLLAKRFDFASSRPKQDTLTTWQRLKNGWYFYFQLPRPLAGSPEKLINSLEKSDLSGQEPLRHLIFERAMSQQIVEKAKQDGIGVNDVAIACLFWTCSQWHGLQRSMDERIRLLMPFDLRTRVDLRMPATNRLSFSFLGRRQSQCSSINQLVVSTTDEIKEIKQTMLPLDFVDGLQSAMRWPRVVQWILRRRRNMATSVLTYTGDISRGLGKHFPEDNNTRKIGDTRLSNIFVAPPTRENTNVSLGLCINWGQLCISAAWNREAFSADDVEAFLQLYKTAWHRWLTNLS
jgi:NRPS condensation-like uncharacterized protein